MAPIDDAFIRTNLSAFENFWHRQLSDAIFALRYPAYGYTVRLQTNDERILDAARLSSPRYGRADPLPNDAQMDLNIVVGSSESELPVPDEFPVRIQTFSAGDYLFQAATPWLQCVTDLNERRACAFISDTLASQPRLVSRYILDRVTNNIALRGGLGQLHATSLVAARGERAVIFIAPHGTGKSTTAFHLLNAGYRLMGDGLLFIRWHDARRGGAERPELFGYPVGEGKLTAEMRLLFPEWHGGGEEVSVHNVRKHIVNLREIAPQKMIDHSIYPRRIVLCLAERNAATAARAEPLDATTTLRRVLPDTIHLDELDAMARSLEAVRRLIERAQCFRLVLGTDANDLVRVVDRL